MDSLRRIPRRTICLARWRAIWRTGGHDNQKSGRLGHSQCHEDTLRTGGGASPRASILSRCVEVISTVIHIAFELFFLHREFSQHFRAIFLAQHVLPFALIVSMCIGSTAVLSRQSVEKWKLLFFNSIAGLHSD